MSLEPPNPDHLDQLLSKHLASTLDPQRGKALKAFRASLAKETQTAPGKGIPSSKASDGNPGFSFATAQERAKSTKRFTVNRFLFTAVTSLLAACIAVVVTLHMNQRKNNTGASP